MLEVHWVPYNMSFFLGVPSPEVRSLGPMGAALTARRFWKEVSCAAPDG